MALPRDPRAVAGTREYGALVEARAHEGPRVPRPPRRRDRRLVVALLDQDDRKLLPLRLLVVESQVNVHAGGVVRAARHALQATAPDTMRDKLLDHDLRAPFGQSLRLRLLPTREIATPPHVDVDGRPQGQVPVSSLSVGRV